MSPSPWCERSSSTCLQINFQILMNPEVWTLIPRNNPIPTRTPSLSHCLCPVSQENWLWKVLVRPMFMLGWKTLWLANLGSYVVEYILAARLCLNQVIPPPHRKAITCPFLTSGFISLQFRAHNTNGRKWQREEGGLIGNSCLDQ